MAKLHIAERLTPTVEERNVGEQERFAVEAENGERVGYIWLREDGSWGFLLLYDGTRAQTPEQALFQMQNQYDASLLGWNALLAGPDRVPPY